jgi:GNAT superfamily N-acetyltransferase
MTNRLTTLGISFWSQHAVGLYTWDFFLPDFGILIDVDGEYWHSRHDRICKDTAKMTYTQRYFPEYRTVRIEEKNFLNPAIVDRLLLALLGQLPAPVKIDFDFANVSVDKVGGKGDPVDVYRSFLDSYHYAQCGRPGFVVYGAVLASELIAVCKFNSVTRQGTPAARGLKCHEVLELDRFCIHPSYQKKNFASWFLSRCISRVFSDYSGIAELVSFADETFGHSGTIYAASNWVYIGHTRPSYHYMDPLGVAINKKRVYDIASKLKMTEREYADKHELAQFAEKPKAKYVFPRRNRRITSSITRLQ